MGLGKVCDISTRTGVVNAGMSKSCFFIMQCIHGLSEEVTEDGPRVFNFRFDMPSVDLESELRKELHNNNNNNKYLE